MKKFELWLDESGDFEEDITNFKKNPSLVGGVLLESGLIDEDKAGHITGRNKVHFTDENGAYKIEVLKKLKDIGTRFIIFENLERVMIVDRDTTYLNIFAEGIIKLLLSLASEHGDFSLDILVAKRKNTVEGRGVIGTDEYEKRLRERVILGLARKILTKKVKWKYSISFGDARTCKRLMLSDCICNTYLTRSSGKFNDEEKKLIGEWYLDRDKFSVLENAADIEVKRCISEGNLGEALAEVYFNEDVSKGKSQYLNLIIERLKGLDEYGVGIHLQAVSSKLEAYFKLWRDYTAIKPVLISLQRELLPLLKENDIPSLEFSLDVILYLYTVYTHEGSSEAEKQDELFRSEFKNVQDLMVKLKYFNLYKNRQSIHMKNMLDILGAVDSLTKQIDSLRELQEMFEIIEGAEDSPGKGKNDALSKLYGSRGQAYTMLINRDIKYLDLALADFKMAEANFTKEYDRRRQYVYMGQAYCEGKEPIAALRLLLTSEGIMGDDEAEIDEFLACFKNNEVGDWIFKLYLYMKIMALALVEGHKTLGESMQKSLDRSWIPFDTLDKTYTKVHPLQFIYWHAAEYFLGRKDYKRALNYINLAIQKCSSEAHQVTLRAIQLGLFAGKALLFMEQNKEREAKDVISRLMENYRALKNNAGSTETLKYFEVLDLEDTGSPDKTKLTKLLSITMCIN